MDRNSLHTKLKPELQGSRGLVQRIRQEWLPSGEELARKAWKKVFSQRTPTKNEVKRHFNKFLCELIDTEYLLYLKYEEACINRGVIEFSLQGNVRKEFPTVHTIIASAIRILNKKQLSDKEKLIGIIQRLHPFYKLVEQSFAQGRMSRAGGSSQLHLKKLLSIAGFENEFEMQQVLNGTVDFLFPNKAVWNIDKRKCVVVSMKRTLRERYKQVFEELDITGGITIYLLVTETLEESEKDITPSKVDKLNSQNIYLVVRDQIKTSRFQDKSNVIGFSDFINTELPQKRAQWLPILQREVQKNAEK